MNKLTVSKIITFVITLSGMVGGNTTSSLCSTNARGNDFDAEYEIGIDGYQVPNDDPVVAGAGDISLCSTDEDTYTAALLANINGDVITFGDNTQLDGTAEEFAECYDPTWGLYKYKTHPSPGNHDYHTLEALPYYDYFGSAAGEVGKGYYSYDIGYWHLIALNSEIDISSDSPQVQWLQADLDSHQNNCVLAYWHRPRFTSGLSYPSDPSIGAIWESFMSMVSMLC
jgi:hypothetical protein